jgi:hypothetical protein
MKKALLFHRISYIYIMSDIDLITDLTQDFSVTIGDNPQEVYGNRLLLNIFEITFLTKKRQFVYNKEVVIDPYGGDAEKIINKQNVFLDSQSLSAALIITINETVKSMQSDETEFTPKTEKIEKAELVSVDIINYTVYATIRIYPMEVEAYADLVWRLPIIKKG